MSEMISKITIKPKIQGEVQVTKVYPELETLVAKPSLKEQYFRPEKYGYSSVTVNAIKTENLNITPSLEKQSFDGIYKEVNVDAIEENKVTITPKTESQLFDGVYTGITVKPIQENNLVVTPKNEQQTFNGVYTDVTVNEIEGDALEVTPSTKIQTFEGVYETVNVNPIVGDNLNVTPTTSSQSFSGVYTNVTVKEVTSDIDKNIKPEIIKKGENILGVEGNFEGGIDTSDATALPENILQGKTAYANNEKITGTMEEYDGSFEGGIAGGEANEHNTTMKMPEDRTDFTVQCGITKISNLDLKGATSLSNAFDGCSYLEEIPEINASEVTGLTHMLRYCYALTTLGGFKDLGKAYTQTTTGFSNYTLDLNSCTNLTHDSLMNVINGLYDLNLTYDVANGGTLYRQILLLGATNADKLTRDEMMIAYNKGWTVS